MSPFIYFLKSVINCERSAYRSMGFEGPLQRMRLHLLRDLAKMYAPKILKEIDKKRRERLHKRKLDSRLTLSTTLYNNKSNRMEFPRRPGLTGAKSEEKGLSTSTGLNESQGTDVSKTQRSEPADLSEATPPSSDPTKASKPKRRSSGGQCMKPMNSTMNVKEDSPKPRKRKGSKSSTKSSEESGLKGNNKPVIFTDKIDEVDEGAKLEDDTNDAKNRRVSLPATPGKSTFQHDSNPFNINSPRPASDPSISFTADSQPHTEVEQSKKIEVDSDNQEGAKTADNDEKSSSSSDSKKGVEVPNRQVDSDAHPAASMKPEEPPAPDTNSKKKRRGHKIKKVDHRKNQQKIHKFFRSLRPKKKKGLVAEPEMDPGVPEKVT